MKPIESQSTIRHDEAIRIMLELLLVLTIVCLLLEKS